LDDAAVGSGDMAASRPGRVQVSSEKRYPVQYLLPGVRKVQSFRTTLSDIPEVSFFREGGPDREPGDLVSGLFDGALDLLLLSLPPFE
jgi:hypothetical protein